MQASKKSIPHCALLIGLLLLLMQVITSCERNEQVYAISDQTVQSPSANKSKLKTDEQYLAILYTNLYQKPMSVSNLTKASDIILSIGDRGFGHDQIVANFMNSPEIEIPSDEEMRADVSGFVQLCYNRFYTREPSALEMEYFVNHIESQEDLSAEMVYYSFAISNEYLYY